MVDTQRQPLVVEVHPANVQDQDGAPAVIVERVPRPRGDDPRSFLSQTCGRKRSPPARG